MGLGIRVGFSVGVNDIHLLTAEPPNSFSWSCGIVSNNAATNMYLHIDISVYTYLCMFVYYIYICLFTSSSTQMHVSVSVSVCIYLPRPRHLGILCM